ncbi:carbohydrate ABC transporter permease [Dictyobacter kobayashii]|uniref:Cytochrome c biogenesis protein n=1 Tax=Dictyobacter kobayashii TaxID=2014872 RepID=A0A402AF89_9CHLR|nr:sugar ABC transporter permease [Dictyobacter kobayashii]GCE17732.1 cytochrome c biogenesis protein [Dictyobacter kobayashii]
MAVTQTQVTARPQAPHAGSWWRRNQRRLAPFLFIAPFYIIFLVFGLYPIFYSFWLSFFKGFGFEQKTFFGLGNYIHMFHDPRYINAVWVTTRFALFSIFILSPLALLVALAINSTFVRWKGLYKTGFFLPTVTSAVIISVIFSRVLDTNYGLLNAMLGWFGIPAIGWLTDTNVVLIAFMILALWNYIGINTLFWLAGLNSINRELNEAASIDGAGRLQNFFYVTMPLLRPIMLLVTIQALIGSYNVFAEPFLLTGGGPSDASLFISVYVYNQGFEAFNVGYASAIAYSMTAILLVLSLLNIKLFGFRGVGD